MRIPRTLAAAGAAAFLAGTVMGVSAPSHAQPLFQGGLVNVSVGDVDILNDVNIAAAIGVAANLCDVNVNVLAVQLRDGSATCDAANDQVVEITPA